MRIDRSNRERLTAQSMWALCQRRAAGTAPVTGNVKPHHNNHRILPSLNTMALNNWIPAQLLLALLALRAR